MFIFHSNFICCLKVKEWIAMNLPFPCLYSVHGLVLSNAHGSDQVSSKVPKKSFILMDFSDNAQKLRCTFVEIDRKLGNIGVGGDRVVVMGRGRADGSLQVFSLEKCDRDQDCYLARLENFAVRGIRQGLQYCNAVGNKLMLNCIYLYSRRHCRRYRVGPKVRPGIIMQS